MANTLHNLYETPDEIQFVHKQDNRPIFNQIKALRESGYTGWMKDRSMQHIGTVPALEYVRLCKLNPDLKDPNKLAKFIESWEGAAYRVVEQGKHKCANIIIK